jgi:hypothetical protein
VGITNAKHTSYGYVVHPWYQCLIKELDEVVACFANMKNQRVAKEQVLVAE